MDVDNYSKSARNKLIAVGTISAIAAIVGIWFVNNPYFYFNEVGTHANLLGFMGSLSLIAGAIKHERRLLYPWFLATSVQLYTILFMSVQTKHDLLYSWDRPERMITMYIIIGVGLLLMKVVYTQFKTMDKNYQHNMGVDNYSKSTRNKLFAIGTITATAAIAGILIVKHSHFRPDDLAYHMNLLGFIGSLLLIAGGIKHEHRLLYPWFLITSVQLYTILFMSNKIRFNFRYSLYSYLTLAGIYIGIGVGLFFLKVVYTQFKKMRKNFEVGDFTGIPSTAATVD